MKIRIEILKASRFYILGMTECWRTQLALKGRSLKGKVQLKVLGCKPPLPL